MNVKDIQARPYELDNDYFKWLCALVDADNERGSYIYLMRYLFETEFSFATARLIPNDDNRVIDGYILREEYLKDCNLIKLIELTGPCSLLEMMIKLAERMEDVVCEFDYIYWFWEMIDNLGFLEYDDNNKSWMFGSIVPVNVYEGVKMLLDRSYTREGSGSLFPMLNSRRDMRDIEIWYQMNNYLVERYM